MGKTKELFLEVRHTTEIEQQKFDECIEYERKTLSQDIIPKKIKEKLNKGYSSE